MSRTKSTTKQTTTKSKVSQKKKNSKTRPALSLTWEVVERGARKRWWWFVGFFIILIWLVSLLVVLQAWSGLAVVVAAAAAIFVTYTRQPRLLTYYLDTTHLAVSRSSFFFKDYRAFTVVEELPTKTNPVPDVTVVLLPQQRLGLPVEITLPESDQDADKVLDIIASVLPFDEAKSYRSSLRAIDRVARWLRIS